MGGNSGKDPFFYVSMVSTVLNFKKNRVIVTAMHREYPMHRNAFLGGCKDGCRNN